MSFIWTNAEEKRFQALKKRLNSKKFPLDRDEGLEYVALKIRKERIETVNAELGEKWYETT